MPHARRDQRIPVTAASTAEPSHPPARGRVTSVAAEIRWAFTPPYPWLLGVGANLVIALLWLTVEPIRAHTHRDWVILVGTYFATFILADVTTTNILGVDASRVQSALRQGVPLVRILLAKNLALLVIVGIPTLAFTAILTVAIESEHRLAVTVPNLALPILAWLGIGNVVSVLLPVAHRSLRDRLRGRGDRRVTVRWVIHLGLPYALYYLVDPTEGPPRILLGRQVTGHLSPDQRGLFHAGAGLLIWMLGTVAAVAIRRRRPWRLDTP